MRPHAHMRDLKSRLNLDVPDIVIDAGIADGIHEEIVRRKADLLVVGRGHDQGIVSRVWSQAVLDRARFSVPGS